jgi:hypothetical protein
MSMKIFRLSSFMLAFVFAAAAFCFDSRGFAGNAIGQNANSSTTTTENSNAGTTRRRRGRRPKQPAATPAESTAPSTEPAASASPDITEQTDLSGTYTGAFDCADAGLTGDTTLTITGNQFTTSDGKSGRITAATTRGYTAVTMQFGELTPGTKEHPSVVPTIVSMRAKKSRDRLTLSSVEGATRVCSFTPAGKSRAAKPRRMPPPAPVAAEPAKPAAAEPVASPVTPAAPVTPGDEAGPMPPPTPSPVRKGRRGSAKPKPTPAVPGN